MPGNSLNFPKKIKTITLIFESQQCVFPKCTFSGPQLSRRRLVWYLLNSPKAHARRGLDNWGLCLSKNKSGRLIYLDVSYIRPLDPYSAKTTFHQKTRVDQMSEGVFYRKNLVHQSRQDISNTVSHQLSKSGFISIF